MSYKNMPIIGVIGGIGPYAGLDFVRKIFDNTRAEKDQDHLNCMLISCSSIIPDRTSFLLGNEKENPAYGIFECARRLHLAGASYVAVACNTSHSNRIFVPFCNMVKEHLSSLNIINMLETCSLYVKKSLPRINCLGLLATKGTYKSRVYHEYFRKEDNLHLIEPDLQGQERVHDAIYNRQYGIKINPNETNPVARDLLDCEISKLFERGAQAVILGCTELPLAIKQKNYAMPIIDPALITARKLIEIFAPEKLLNSKKEAL